MALGVVEQIDGGDLLSPDPTPRPAGLARAGVRAVSRTRRSWHSGSKHSSSRGSPGPAGDARQREGDSAAGVGGRSSAPASEPPASRRAPAAAANPVANPARRSAAHSPATRGFPRARGEALEQLGKGDARERAGRRAALTWRWLRSPPRGRHGGAPRRRRDGGVLGACGTGEHGAPRGVSERLERCAVLSGCASDSVAAAVRRARRARIRRRSARPLRIGQTGARGCLGARRRGPATAGRRPPRTRRSPAARVARRRSRRTAVAPV